MKLHQHWKVGEMLLSKLDNKYKIGRTAYLIGNIAPDLNCIYPAHRLNTTEKRFARKLRYIDKSNNNLLRSFQLGVVTHYLCDYFCYAHIIESVGATHKKYEKNLYEFYKAHVNELHNEWLDIFWHKNKEESINEVAHTYIINSDEHCDIILTQIRKMAEQYKSEMVHYTNKLWAFDYKQIQRDIDYAMFMVDNIIKLILEPNTCCNTYI